jgi:uncharacterized protein (DUF433 family)
MHPRHADSVVDILDLLAAGLSNEQVLQALPDLELEDILVSLLCASARPEAALERLLAISPC